MLYPFPTDLPYEGIALIIDKLRGKDVPLKSAVNAAWNLAGYAAAQVTPEEPKVIGDIDCTDDEAAEMLENLLALKDGKVMMVPWVIVLRIALKILMAAF